MLRNVLLLGFLAAAVSGVLGGCNPVSVAALGLDTVRQDVQGQNADAGLVDSKYERWARLNLIRDIEDRQFRDDLDTILLLDRNSYLTQWHPGVLR